MTDTPNTPTPAESPHAWVHEHLAAYLADGLSAEERQRFDEHVNSCAECFDAFTEARDADRALQRAFAGLAPESNLEENVVTHFRENTMKRLVHPMLRRAGYAAAACVALAATGVFANYVLHTDGKFSNPFSQKLVAEADAASPELNGRIAKLAEAPGVWWGQEALARPAVFLKGQAEVVALDSATSEVEQTVGGIVDSNRNDVTIRKSLPATQPSVSSLARTWDTPSPTADALITDAKKLYDAHQYQEAHDLAEKATLIDPQNESAALLGRLAASKATDRDYEAIVHRTGIEGMQQSRVESFNQTVAAGGGTVVMPGIGNSALAFNDSVDKPLDAQHFKSSDELRLQSVNNGTQQPGGQQGSQQGQTQQVVPLDPNAPRTSDSYGWVEGGYTYNHRAATSDSTDGRAMYGWKYSYDRNSSAPPAGGNGAGVDGKALALGDAHGDFTFGAGISGSSGLTGQMSTEKPVTRNSLTVSNTQIENGGVLMPGTKDALRDKELATEDLKGNALALSGGPLRVGTDLNEPSHRYTFGIDDNGKKSAEENAAKYRTSATFDGPVSMLDTGAGKLNTGLPAAGEERAGVSSSVLKPVFTETGETVDLNRHAITHVNGDDLGEHLIAAASGTGAPSTGAPAPVGTPASQGAAAQAPAPKPAPDVAAGLKIIRNGTIEFEVSSFNDAYKAVSRIAGAEHGFVASTSSDKLANGKVRGTIVVRVPPENLEEFLTSLRALGDLKSQQIAASDVTKDYYDIASELRGLTTMETRLLDLIKNGKGEVKDLIEAEKQLGETRIKIERLKGQISYYDNLVSLCTISIVAYEKDIQTPTGASEQEIVGVNVETEQVESKYQAARKIFEDAKGRIVESQLKNTDADHVAAHIVAEVPPEQADFVAGQLKQLGKVASFNRDRKQTTTGGSGGPNPAVQVEHKDTRITIDLFNLANMQPRETTVLRVAVANVETAYSDILSRVRKDAPDGAAPPALPTTPPAAADKDAAPRAVGHVIASALNGQADQMTADVRAEVRAESADDVIKAILGYGEVEYRSLANNPDNASTTSAKRGIQLTLVNIASVPPRQINSVNVAVRNVDEAYNTLLQAIRRQAPATQPGTVVGAQLMPATVGRVVSSGENGQRPEEKSGDIRAEIRADQADDILNMAEKSGELLTSATTDIPESTVATAIRRGLVVHFVNIAGVAPREAQQIRAVALDVPKAYQTLLNALQNMADKAPTGAGGNVHIFNSSLTGNDRRTMKAHFTFDAPRSADADIAKAFADAGIDFLSRNIVRSSDTANTLDSKIRYQIDEIGAAESLEPRRTFLLTEEVPDVDKAVNDLRAAFPGLDFNVSHPQDGNASAHAIADVSVEESRNLRMAIANLHAVEKDNQVLNNNNVPETKFGRERIDVTFRGEAPILKKDQGVNSAFRAAMSTISAALFTAIYLIIVGLVFALPFVLVLWPVWRMIRRRRATVRA